MAVDLETMSQEVDQLALVLAAADEILIETERTKSNGERNHDLDRAAAIVRMARAAASSRLFR